MSRSNPMTPIALLAHHSTPEPNTGCCLWTGATNNWGYGRLSYPVLGQRAAHRLSFAAHVSVIPRGSFVLHRCDTPACINPDHLYIGDHAANTRDRVARDRCSRPAGDRAPSAKLSWPKVVEMRAESAIGASVSALARKYGVDRRAIRLALRGETWRT